MKNFIWAVLFIPVSSIAQPLHITAWGGFSGYQGDLESKRNTIAQSNFAFGFGVKYDLTAHLAIRAGFNSGKIGADDKKNEPNLRARNLSFQSRITEGNLLLDYSLFGEDPEGARGRAEHRHKRRALVENRGWVREEQP